MTRPSRARAREPNEQPDDEPREPGDEPDGGRASSEPSEPPKEPTFDATLRASIRAVAYTGAVLAVGVTVGFGWREGLGVLAGGVVATVNLLALARIISAMLDAEGASGLWGALALLKLLALLTGVWMILRSGFVSPLMLTVGYLALPVGIVIGSTLGAPKSRQPRSPAQRKGRPKSTR
jgi:hypothetical protein